MHCLATPCLILSLLIFTSSTTAQPHFIACSNKTSNYSLNSPFENNLNAVLDSLSSNTSLRNGFYNISMGNGLDQLVYGQALCRGDVSQKECHNCVVNVSREIKKECQSKEATLWHEFCQVAYSFSDFFSSMTYAGRFPDEDYADKYVSDLVNFPVVLKGFMNNLSNKSSFETKLMFKTGETKFSKNETIYGLVQCTRDISQSACLSCLNQALGDLYACCSVRQGGIIFNRNCNVRFELFRFYNESKGSHRLKVMWVVAIAAACILLAMGLAFLIGCYLFQHRKKDGALIVDDEVGQEENQNALFHNLVSPTGIVITEEGILVGSRELPFIELAIIKAATDNFSASNKLGQGGFGTVYKGVLPNGKEIAVKRLSRKSWQGLEEFKNEIILIAKLQHRNLVRLLGCGIEGDEKLLIYEYMANRSLDVFIFEKCSVLNWSIRLNIIHGIARGLLYLHEESRLKIVHRDLKPSNILLDHEMVAKISDFGMARIFGVDQNTANTRRVVGTYGYMAPEYAMEGLFSVKSDVFSFGVILLEIISGRKNNGFHLTGHAQSLLDYAWRLWNEGQEMEFVDPLLTESCPMAVVARCIHIGLLCVQEDPGERPTMSSVVVLLESNTIEIPQPKPPAVSVGRDFARLIDNSTSLIDPSVNQLTVSIISPR